MSLEKISFKECVTTKYKSSNLRLIAVCCYWDIRGSFPFPSDFIFWFCMHNLEYMLNDLSSYWKTLDILLTIYYVWLCVYFFRSDRVKICENAQGLYRECTRMLSEINVNCSEFYFTVGRTIILGKLESIVSVFWQENQWSVQLNKHAKSKV